MVARVLLERAAVALILRVFSGLVINTSAPPTLDVRSDLAPATASARRPDRMLTRSVSTSRLVVKPAASSLPRSRSAAVKYAESSTAMRSGYQRLRRHKLAERGNGLKVRH